MDAARNLIPIIYHETQERGSRLCGLHALNNLLQDRDIRFDESRLAEVARGVDADEQLYDESYGGASSSNMDDTGYFSIQVLQRALERFGLKLTQWRSQDMRQYHDHPQTQLAFILHHDDHWYVLRRFGAVWAEPSSLTSHSDAGIWFNLDSVRPQPEYVGSTYLGMFIQQAEQAKYSVFAVQKDDLEEGKEEDVYILPLSKADQYAASLVVAGSRGGDGAGGGSGEGDGDGMDYGEEDMELQAALQASLMNHAGGGGDIDPSEPASGSSSGLSAILYPPPISAHPYTNPLGLFDRPSGIQTPTQRTHPGYSKTTNDDDEDYVDASEESPPPESAGTGALDPVEASRRRNEALMRQMMRQQEAAMRVTHQEEELRVRAGLQTRRRTQQDEEEEMERAIRASMAEAEEEERAGEGAETVEEPEEVVLPQRRAEASHAVYDDEDEALQAALRASLETVPEGFQIPPTPPRVQAQLPTPPATALLPPPSASASAPSIKSTESESTEDDTAETESEADSSMATETPAVKVDVEEMRKLRLARFGG
ncbi:hypothetical protein EIP91_003089 [Steccherinum ochraceum]|uniref:ubiquitinyl hydrolase 1 n=1 Tax=Steccherinum ochraceum TaxID=92696 RepID=A0A4R0RH96_9APHY|nr:hypothetical protein EIP91_003089 [Steccherinum ochraceum]